MPKRILELIRERGKKGLPLGRVYRQLFNRELFLKAYAKIYRNKGATTHGVTDETPDGMSLKKIDAIIEALRYERYQWLPATTNVYPEKEREKATIGDASVVGQTGTGGGATHIRGVLRTPVQRPLARVSPRTRLSHRAQGNLLQLARNRMVH